MTPEQQSRIIIISGPSGVGKSTIIKDLLQRNKQKLEFSVSTTTRSKRPNEQEGKDYFFINTEEFKNKIEQQEFLEWAKVHNNYYGTDIKTIEHTLSQNNNMHCLLDIDVQGAISIYKIYPYAKRIFILPPSLDELKNRLISRGDTKDIDLRLNNAIDELGFLKYYNYFVVHNTTAIALQEIEIHIYGTTQ